MTDKERLTNLAFVVDQVVIIMDRATSHPLQGRLYLDLREDLRTAVNENYHKKEKKDHPVEDGPSFLGYI